MFDMKAFTIRQVLRDFGAVLTVVSGGEEVTVLNRTRPVARICPPRAATPVAVKMPDYTARARRLFGKTKPMPNIILDEREQSQW